MKTTTAHFLRRLGDQIGAIYTPLAISIAIAAWALSANPSRFLAVLNTLRTSLTPKLLTDYNPHAEASPTPLRAAA